MAVAHELPPVTLDRLLGNLDGIRIAERDGGEEGDVAEVEEVFRHLPSAGSPRLIG